MLLEEHTRYIAGDVVAVAVAVVERVDNESGGREESQPSIADKIKFEELT